MELLSLGESINCSLDLSGCFQQTHIGREKMLGIRGTIEKANDPLVMPEKKIKTNSE